MHYRIFSQNKSAMQSGRAKVGVWMLEPVHKQASKPSPLMGWSGGGETNRQVNLQFDTKEQAIEYAVKNGIAYELYEPQERIIKPKAYADNFVYTKLKPWTH